VDNTNYHILWLASLVPDIAMLPGEAIFQTTQEQSLTAIHPGQPGLLFTSPADLIEIADQLEYPEPVEQTPHSMFEDSGTDANVIDDEYSLLLAGIIGK
jgi:hypothetical protein